MKGWTLSKKCLHSLLLSSTVGCASIRCGGPAGGSKDSHGKELLSDEERSKRRLKSSICSMVSIA